MARIEWVKYRLSNWALWKVRESSGGMGFATVSVLLANRVDESRDSPLPVDEIDAGKTNLAVESLKPTQEHLYHTLHCIYIEGAGIKMSARILGCAESTVKARLDQADHAISAWFGAQAEVERRRPLHQPPLSLLEQRLTKRGLST